MENLIEIPDYYFGEPFYRQGKLWKIGRAHV